MKKLAKKKAVAVALKPVHCNKCKTNFWRHPKNAAPEKCGVCLAVGGMIDGHVTPPKRKRLKDRH